MFMEGGGSDMYRMRGLVLFHTFRDCPLLFLFLRYRQYNWLIESAHQSWMPIAIYMDFSQSTVNGNWGGGLWYHSPLIEEKLLKKANSSEKRYFASVYRILSSNFSSHFHNFSRWGLTKIWIFEVFRACISKFLNIFS